MQMKQENKEVRVTIITPSYNQGQFIEHTILSVLNQTYRNIQYIIIDGGSTDDTMDVVNKYKDKIDIIIHERDNGQSNAINKGFKLADGQLAGWINSDDILYPTCVERIVQLYNAHPEGSIYYSDQIDFLDAIGNVTETKEIPIPNRDYLLNINFDVIQQGSFYNMNLLKKVNYCNEDIHYCMDLDLWLRLLEHADIYAIQNCPVAGFRFWEGTKTVGGGIKFYRNIFEVLQKHGVNPKSPNIRRIKWDVFKLRVKSLLKSLKLIN